MRPPGAGAAAPTRDRLLLTHFGRIVFCDGDGRLRQGDIGTAPRNVRLTEAGELVVGGAVRAVEPVAWQDALIGLKEGPAFLRAERDGAVTLSGEGMTNWGRFLPIDPDDLSALAYALGRGWIDDAGQAIAPGAVRLGRGFVLRFGPYAIDLRSPAFPLHVDRGAGLVTATFTHDAWKVVRATAFRPLIYYTVFGDDSFFEMLFIALSSLVETGGYAGDVAVVSDRSAAELDRYLPTDLRSRVIAVRRHAPSRIRMLSARYALDEAVSEDHQPVLYSDTDIVCVAPIAPILERIVSEGRFCTASEFTDAPPELIRKKAHWFGGFLFAADTAASVAMQCVNSGVIGFPSRRFAEGAFGRIINCLDHYARHEPERLRLSDQPFASYVLQRLGTVRPGALNDFVRLVNGGGDGDLPEEILIHFNVGVGRSGKLALMREAWEASRERRRNGAEPRPDQG